MNTPTGKRRDIDPATDSTSDGEAAFEWPECLTCDADTLVATVDGVALIGRPFTDEEAAAYGLRCTQCGETTDGFPLGVYAWRH